MTKSPLVGARGLPRAWLIGAVAFFAVAALVSLSVGAYPIGVWAIVRGGLSHLPLLGIRSPMSATESAIVWQLRVPRMLLGALVGMMLATAGASYQGTFRNPLADPFLLGVSQGAGLGATLVIVFVSGASGSMLLPLAAFIGGLLAVAATYVLGASAAKGGGAGALILAGVTVAAFLTAIETYLQQRSQSAQAVFAWILGGLAGASWHDLLLTAPWIIVALVVLVAHRRILDLMSVGDDDARALGLNVERARLVILLTATIGTAAAVAVSGLIGFVGIIVPHAVRLVVSSSYRAILPLAMIFGAGFLILADVIARSVLSPSELPIGVVTAFFGAPFFGVVLRRTRWVSL